MIPKYLFGIGGVKHREVIRWFNNPDIAPRRMQRALDYYERKSRGRLSWEPKTGPNLIHKGRKP